MMFHILLATPPEGIAAAAAVSVVAFRLTEHLSRQIQELLAVIETTFGVD